MRTGRRLVHCACLLALSGMAAASGTASPARGGSGPCPPGVSPDGYGERVSRALESGRDVWGNELLAGPEGPTYGGVRRFLHPLLLAGGPGRRPLTDSGVYYLPFAQPRGAEGATSVALHVADGSEVVAQRVGGPTLTVGVGVSGGERYGSCLARLATPGLLGGFLPVLETRYVDSVGVRYRQESFAGRLPESDALVSFVRIVADARRARGSGELRFTSSVAGRLAAGPGGSFDGTSAAYGVERGRTRTVDVAWLDEPAPPSAVRLAPESYEAARRSTIRYWQDRLSEGATFLVPEKRVLDAEQSLLVQDLDLTWRYSIGNPYEEFSFPESVDVAEVLGEYGFEDVARAILLTSLQRSPTPYPNWKMGEKLLGSALQYRLFADRSYIDEVTPVLSDYVDTLGRQLAESGRNLLQRERYSSDIADSVFGLHSQTVVWQGLREMARVWARTGHASLAERCRALASRLERGLRAAVRASERRLADGSLFVPVRLLDPEPAHGALTASRAGSYWNLVMPYALASGFFAPGSREARGVFVYLTRHGSRLLGLVRAAAYALYGNPAYPTSGTDQVYGTNMARFLADNDLADQLVLSLYGHLGAGMTPGTFVSGEAASVAPLRRDYYRSMYLPPNGASNAAFLETLRLMLVHETRNRSGDPNGLELAYATPRAWLAPGRRIVVRSAPTSFGPISFSIQSLSTSVRVTLDAPERERPPRLSLRLRLPGGARITGVTLGDRPYSDFDPRTGTIDLSSRQGRLELDVAYERRG